MESLSVHEREESVEITQLTYKLCQYENKQRRCEQLLEHISSFFKEKEADENNIMQKYAVSLPAQSAIMPGPCAAAFTPPSQPRLSARELIKELKDA